MTLHDSKITALLYSLNAISPKNVTSLKDLSDGTCLMNILTSTFNESYNHTQDGEKKPFENDETLGKKSDEGSKLDSIDVYITGDENANDICYKESIDSLNDANILKRFNFIQNFINERYSLRSEEIITYPKCILGNEFELAKVAIFILSEVVKYYVISNDNRLQTLSHFDTRIQEDLEECFHLFISERESISKNEVEKILSNPATYKSQSPKNLYSTPKTRATKKYKYEFSKSPATEEVFSNSPLTSFFESPIFKKEDILLKEKEIARTRNNLHEEELKSEELQIELNNAMKKIEEKDREIQALKATLKEQESQELLNFEEELKQLQEKYNSLEKESSCKYKEYEKEIVELMKQNSFLKYEAKENLGYSRYQNLNKQELIRELIHKDTLLGKKNEALRNYRLKQTSSFIGINKMQNMLDAMTEKLEAEREKSKCLEIQAAKEREFYSTKLSELKQTIRNEPESPGTGENLGVIIEEENRILQVKLDIAKKRIKQLEEELQDINKYHQNNVPKYKNAFNRSIVEILDLPETPRCEKRKSAVDHTCTVEVLDLSATPKIKRYSEEFKELTNLSVTCDTSRNSESVFRNSPASLHSEVPFNENTNEPVLEEIGILWKNKEDSQLEFENADSAVIITDLNSPINCDKITNNSVSLCHNCNTSKNGYKFSAAPFERSANIVRELKKKEQQLDKISQELKKKDEEIDKLKATCEFLQTQSEDYLETVKESNKTIEKLKNKIIQMKKTSEAKDEDYMKYTKRFSALEERVADYDRLLEKYKNLELSMHKTQEMYKYEIKTLKSNRSKKEQEILSLHGQMKQINREKNIFMKRNNELEKNLKILKHKEEDSLRKLKETEEKLQKLFILYQKAKESKSNINKVEQPADFVPESSYLSLNPDTPNNMNNESTLSGALCKRNNFITNGNVYGDDEDPFSSHTKVPSPSDNLRFEELMKRNSILPNHLQSSYPTEMNLTPSVEKFYFRNTENVDIKSRKMEISNQCKKRKLEEFEGESSESAGCSSTPLIKERRSFFLKTPSSMKRLFQFRRSHRDGFIKPKP